MHGMNGGIILFNVTSSRQEAIGTSRSTTP